MSLKILLVDDDPCILEIVSRWLNENGYKDVTSVSTFETLNGVLDKSWDIVISDVYFPGLCGIQVAERIKSRNTQTRVILMTGHVTTELTLQALDVDVDAFLPKPFERTRLIEKVRRFDLLLSGQKSTRERILAIGAHPDDVEIGCGGELINRRSQGDEVCILTLSVGNKGGNSERRRNESEKAASILGAKLVLGDLVDTCISEGAETIALIKDTVDTFKPTTIYTHTLSDSHQDHRNTHRATMVASRGVPRVHAYQSPSSTIQFMPSRFADITRSLETKQKLISCYQSQHEKCAYLTESMIASTAEYWGRFSGFVKVEPFETVRSN